MTGLIFGGILATILVLIVGAFGLMADATCSEESSGSCALLWIVGIPLVILQFLAKLALPVILFPWAQLIHGAGPTNIVFILGTALNFGIIGAATLKLTQRRRRDKAK